MQGLVREYLTRNGLSSTLQDFERERVGHPSQSTLQSKKEACFECCLQPRGPHSISSRTALRKSLGLERLPVKVNKPQTTSTLELWVLYQQLKLTAAAAAADKVAKQVGDGISQAVRTQSHHEPETPQTRLSLSADAHTQAPSRLPALQLPAPADGTSNQIHACHQQMHMERQTQQVLSRPHVVHSTDSKLPYRSDAPVSNVTSSNCDSS